MSEVGPRGVAQRTGRQCNGVGEAIRDVRERTVGTGLPQPVWRLLEVEEWIGWLMERQRTRRKADSLLVKLGRFASVMEDTDGRSGDHRGPDEESAGRFDRKHPRSSNERIEYIHIQFGSGQSSKQCDLGENCLSHAVNCGDPHDVFHPPIRLNISKFQRYSGTVFCAAQSWSNSTVAQPANRVAPPAHIFRERGCVSARISIVATFPP